MFQHLRRGPERRNRVRDALTGDVEGGSVNRLEHRREAAFGVDVGGWCHTKASGQRSGKIRQDIGMQVGGDDGVKASRVLDHAHRHRIDQHLVPGHIGKFPRDFRGDFVPHDHAEPLRVGLGDDCQQFARPGLGQSEGIAHDPGHADAGKDRHFGSDFFGQPVMRAAAVAGVFAFRVFAHDDPIEIPDARFRSGDVMPGMIRVGRTLAY